MRTPTRGNSFYIALLYSDSRVALAEGYSPIHPASFTWSSLSLTIVNHEEKNFFDVVDHIDDEKYARCFQA